MRTQPVVLAVTVLMGIVILAAGVAVFVTMNPGSPGGPAAWQERQQAQQQARMILEQMRAPRDVVVWNDVEPAPFMMENVAEAAIPIADVQGQRGAVAPAADCKLTGPFTHDNLSVFLIHGPETLKGKTFLTLPEALEQKLAVVHETHGSVLAVENRSRLPLFIQSGDIVKGGQQDRVLPYDEVVPPDSGRVPLAAFCVERGRSGPRGQEPLAYFQSANEVLPGRQLKLASLLKRSQFDIQANIWTGVSQAQASLARNVGGPVQGEQSPTSLQLTLENSRVQNAIQGYVDKLTPAVGEKNDVIGCVFVVNGQVQTAEVYASASLFQRLWPRLLRAGAVDALSERNGQATPTTPTAEEVQAFLNEADRGTASRQTTSNRVQVVRQETNRLVRFDTCDRGQQNLVVHRTVLAK
jgi:hypothetical protein